MAHFLVTGGCGFIGAHLVDALVANQHAVTVLDELSTGQVDNLPAAANLIVGCVTDTAAVTRASERVDGVFHLAAIASVARSNSEWLWTHRVNQTGTVTILDVARSRGVPMVYASSAAVYGVQGGDPLAETLTPRPLTAYGADKLGRELHGAVAATIHGVPTLGLRFFNVYGPRQPAGSPYSGVISVFAHRVTRGLPLVVHGDGSQTRDFVYVGDVVRALFLAMQHCRAASAAAARIANVCTGRAVSIADLARDVMAAAGRSVSIEHTVARAGHIPASVGDPALAEDLFGFRATTELAVGLKALLAATAHAPI